MGGTLPVFIEVLNMYILCSADIDAILSTVDDTTFGELHFSRPNCKMSIKLKFQK